MYSRPECALDTCRWTLNNQQSINHCIQLFTAVSGDPTFNITTRHNNVYNFKIFFEATYSYELCF